MVSYSHLTSVQATPNDVVIYTTHRVLQSHLELDFIFNDVLPFYPYTVDLNEALSARCIVYLEHDLDVELARTLKSLSKKLVLMHLGDETAVKDLSAYEYADVIFRNYFHQHIFTNPQWVEKLHWMPNGYRNGLSQGDRVHKPARRRKQLARFIGWLDNPHAVGNERGAFAAVATACEPQLHCISTRGFADGFSPHLYKHLMEESIFAPCPAGNAAETIRLFDALECGCIPISLGQRFLIANETFTESPPFIILSTWHELITELKKFSEQEHRDSLIDDLQTDCLNFWQRTKQDIRESVRLHTSSEHTWPKPSKPLLSVMNDPIQNDIVTLKDHARSCSWLAGYGTVSELANATNAKSILEIGVAYGYHALHLLEHCPGIKYTGVDPYVADYDPTDQLAQDVEKLFPMASLGAEVSDTPMTRLYKAVSETVKEKSKSARVERDTFLTFSIRHPQEKFDVIYIDGNHTEEGVFSDCILALRHIARHGLICGDDIEWKTVQSGLLKFAGLYRLSPKLHQHPTTGKVTWIIQASEIDWLPV